MEEDNTKALGWGAIIAILVGVAVFTGLLLGLMNRLFGLSPGMAGGGIGACVGVVGALLVARRRAAMTRHNNH